MDKELDSLCKRVTGFINEKLTERDRIAMQSGKRYTKIIAGVPTPKGNRVDFFETEIGRPYKNVPSTGRFISIRIDQSRERPIGLAYAPDEDRTQRTTTKALLYTYPEGEEEEIATHLIEYLLDGKDTIALT